MFTNKEQHHQTNKQTKLTENNTVKLECFKQPDCLVCLSSK